MVIILDPSKLTHNNHKILEKDLPMTMANLTTHILACGDSFSISERSVEVMPLELYFNQ